MKYRWKEKKSEAKNELKIDFFNFILLKDKWACFIFEMATRGAKASKSIQSIRAYYLLIWSTAYYLLISWPEKYLLSIFCYKSNQLY